MGELSKVYQFRTDDNAYVVHFRLKEESLLKAEAIYEQFGSLLPIPRTLQRGTKNGVHYLISQRAEGAPVSSLSDEKQVQLSTHLADVYSQINETTTSAAFGIIEPGKQPSDSSWLATLERFFIEEEDSFYGHWKTLFTNSMLEKDVFEQGYGKMMELATYAPKQPYLVHGDFHTGNFIAAGDRITAIVDWEMAMQGDFMFDLAGLHFWSPHLQFPEKMKTIWQEQNKTVPYFKERLYAGLLFKATDGLRFYAKQEHPGGYELMKTRLNELLLDL